MATKLTVKRSDLIKAIKDKAKKNQSAHDKAMKEYQAELDKDGNALVKAFNNAIDEHFGVGASTGKYNKAGTVSKANIQGYMRDYVYNYLGIKNSPLNAPVEPKLFEAELAILEMATDETLTVDDNSDYFSFLKK